MLALGKIQDVGQQVVLAGSVWLPASSGLLASCQTFLVHLLVFVEFFGHWPTWRKDKQQAVVSAGLSSLRKDLCYPLRLELKIARCCSVTQPSPCTPHRAVSPSSTRWLMQSFSHCSGENHKCVPWLLIWVKHVSPSAPLCALVVYRKKCIWSDSNK